MPDAVYSPAAMTVLVVVLIPAMAGHDRIAGVGALVWTALRFSGVMAGIDVAGYPAAVLPADLFHRHGREPAKAERACASV